MILPKAEEKSNRLGKLEPSSLRSLIWLFLGTCLVFLVLEKTLLNQFVTALFWVEETRIAQQTRPNIWTLVLGICAIAIAVYAASTSLLVALYARANRQKVTLLSAYSFVVAQGYVGLFPGFPRTHELWNVVGALWVLGTLLLTYFLIGSWSDQLTKRRPLHQKTVWVSILLVIALVAIPQFGGPRMGSAAILALSPLVGMCAIWIVQHTSRAGVTAKVEAVLGAAILLYAIEWTMNLSSIDAPIYSLYAPVPTFLLGGIFMSRSLIKALQGSEQWSEHILIKHAQDYERDRFERSEAERKRAIDEERDRLARDVHDGIGAKILSLIVRVRTDAIERPELEAELKASLDDLRLIIDSLEIDQRDLWSALQSFKARIDPQLDATDIRLHWNINDPEIRRVDLESSEVLSVYRFLMETVANVLQHAHARTLTIEGKVTSSDIVTISVEDDGDGFNASARRNSGNGVANMRKRAARLSGEVNFFVGSNNCGTRVELIFPSTKTSPISSPNK